MRLKNMKLHLDHQMDLLSVNCVLVWQLLLIAVMFSVSWEYVGDMQCCCFCSQYSPRLRSCALSSLETWTRGSEGENIMNFQLPFIKGIQLVL